MERTSLITTLLVAPTEAYNQIQLVHGLPDSTSLDRLFEKCPFITEKAEITEATDSNDQGDLIRYTVTANSYRNSTFHETYRFRNLLLYIVTLNGERLFLGTDLNPVRLTYNRQSGSAISDPNETSLNFLHILPV